MVLLTHVSCNYTDMFQNWIESVRRVGLQDYVSVIAEDHLAYDRIVRLSPKIHVVLSDFARAHNNECDYDENVYKAVVVRRGRHISKYLKRGVPVLYSDVDACVPT